MVKADRQFEYKSQTLAGWEPFWLRVFERREKLILLWVISFSLPFLPMFTKKSTLPLKKKKKRILLVFKFLHRERPLLTCFKIREGAHFSFYPFFLFSGDAGNIV